jgi:hypothetical protein
MSGDYHLPLGQEQDSRRVFAAAQAVRIVPREKHAGLHRFQIERHSEVRRHLG